MVSRAQQSAASVRRLVAIGTHRSVSRTVQHAVTVLGRDPRVRASDAAPAHLQLSLCLGEPPAVGRVDDEHHPVHLEKEVLPALSHCGADVGLGTGQALEGRGSLPVFESAGRIAFSRAPAAQCQPRAQAWRRTGISCVPRSDSRGVSPPACPPRSCASIFRLPYTRLSLPAGAKAMWQHVLVEPVPLAAVRCARCGRARHGRGWGARWA